MDLKNDNPLQLTTFLKDIRETIKQHRDMEAKVIAEMTLRGMAIPVPTCPEGEVYNEAVGHCVPDPALRA